MKFCSSIIYFDQWQRTLDSHGYPLYAGCAISGQQPNTWLRSNLIIVPSKLKKVDVSVVYSIRNCTLLNGDNFCREYFDFHVHQSMTSSTPDPLQHNATYEKIAEITAPILGFNARVQKKFDFEVKGNYITLAFHNQGSCSTIYAVTVSYYVCPEFKFDSGLVSLPRFTAPVNSSEPVVGSCVTNAVSNQGNISMNCQSDGFWNISSLKGRCVCREDTEVSGGECKGMYLEHS